MKAAAQKKVVHRSEQAPEVARTTVGGGLKSIGSDVMKGFWQDFFKASVQEIPEPFLPGGLQASKKRVHGELTAGQEVSLKTQEQTQEKAVAKRAAHGEYFRRIERTEIYADRNEQQIIERRVSEIKQEIKQLMKASKQMETAFRDVAKDTMTNQTENEKYHLNFFDWILSMLKNARAKLEDGAAWTRAASGKKKQKQYWSMFKKHGTSFGLSSERTLATQTG